MPDLTPLQRAQANADLPYGASAFSSGAAAVARPTLTPTPAPQASLLDRVLGMFHTTPSPVPKMISNADALEQQLNVLQARSSR